MSFFLRWALFRLAKVDKSSSFGMIYSFQKIESFKVQSVSLAAVPTCTSTQGGGGGSKRKAELTDYSLTL